MITFLLSLILALFDPMRDNGERPILYTYDHDGNIRPIRPIETTPLDHEGKEAADAADKWLREKQRQEQERRKREAGGTD